MREMNYLLTISSAFVNGAITNSNSMSQKNEWDWGYLESFSR